MNHLLVLSCNIEFKETWNDEYLKWICGFANAQGGTLYVGIRDDDTLARRGRAMNQHLLSITEKTWAPSTVMGWYSKLIAEKYDSTGPHQKTRGRKPISDELKELILRLADQNPTWGYKRIRDYAVYLGFEVSFMTVKRLMNKYGYFPSGE